MSHPFRDIRRLVACLALGAALAGCVADTPDSTAFAKDTAGDAAAADGGGLDAAAGADSTVATDGAALDAGSSDAPSADAGLSDASDAVQQDTAQPDTAEKDTAPPDTGSPDTGSPDTGQPDTAQPDTAPPDTTGCLVAQDCDDGKVCTLDLCNPSDGTCNHKPHTGACDDGDPCTLDDACSAGSCKGGVPRYVRRELAAKAKVSGGVLARSGEKVALAGRAQDRPYLFGLDKSGLIAWSAAPGGTTATGAFHTVVPHHTGAFVAAGWLASVSGGAVGYFAHVGATGTVIKTGKLTPSALSMEVRGVVPAAKGSLVNFAGYAHDGSGSWQGVYGRYDVVQGKAAGSLSYLGGGSASRAAYGVVPVGSNHLVFGWGGQKSSDKQAWIYAVNAATGFKAYEVMFGNSSSDEAFFGAAKMPDAGLLAAGYTTWNNSSSTKLNVWLVRTDVQGKSLWQRTFGTDADDFATAVLPTPGGALLAGVASQKSGVQGLGTLWQVDAFGNVAWQRSHNLSGLERLESLVASPDGVLVGGTQVTASQSRMVFLRTDAFGHASCSQSGVCAGKATCDDGDLCSADDCDAGKGCVHPPHAMGTTCGLGKTCTSQQLCK